jgi:hypothetical protein
VSATKLTVANGAMRLLKTRKLTAAELSGNTRESARVVNEVWDGDFVRGILEAGNWRFAVRSRQITADPGIDPQFDGEGGYLYAYAKSDDWLRTCGVFSDPDMRQTCSDYNDEAGYIFANVDTLYVRHISDDVSFGGNLAIWPRSFQEFAEAKLAANVAGPMTQEAESLEALAARRLAAAISKDVINEPTRRQQHSSWVRARFSGGGDQQRRSGSS